MRSKRDIRLAVSIFMAIAMALILPGLSIAGSLEPSGAPAPTMKTLDQIPPTWSQKLPAAERFVLVLDNNGVLDKETGLVWERSPDQTHRTWGNAVNYCYPKNVGVRLGWRLPTVEELASLVDSTHLRPALPSGHPFDTNCTSGGCVQSFPYWSATTNALGADGAWYVDMDNGHVDGYSKTGGLYVWCVRGGQGYDGY